LKLSKDLKILKETNKDAYNLLKVLVAKSKGNKTQDNKINWCALPNASAIKEESKFFESLVLLEQLNLIYTENLSLFIIINKHTEGLLL